MKTKLVRGFAFALYLTAALILRGAIPLDQQPAAFQELVKLGTGSFETYALSPHETALRFTDKWKGTDADLSKLNELTTTRSVVINGDKNTRMVLPHLAAMPALESIALEDVTLSAAQIKLLSALRAKSIRITTKSSTICLDGFTHVEGLVLEGPLEHITLTGVPLLNSLHIETASTQHPNLILELPSAPKLQFLDLKNFTLTEFPLSATLETIEFSNCTVPNALLEKIGQLKKLTWLDLSGVENANVALSCLGDSHLKMLAAEHAHVTDEAIASIKDLSLIECLKLRGNPALTGKGMAPIGTASGGIVLQILFSDAAVGDNIVATLAKNTTSRPIDISLDGTDITDQGVATLARLPLLSSISLRDTTITDVALRALSAAKNLHEITFSSPHITADGIAALKKALPETRIYDYGHGETPVR